MTPLGGSRGSRGDANWSTRVNQLYYTGIMHENGLTMGRRNGKLGHSEVDPSVDSIKTLLGNLRPSALILGGTGKVSATGRELHTLAVYGIAGVLGECHGVKGR